MDTPLQGHAHDADTPEIFKRKLRRLTKSEVVTKLLAQYLALQAPKKTAYRIAKEVGLLKGFAGPADLARNRKRHLRT